MNKLSVVLAVRNEEKNIASCLSSIKDIADEIIVVDEYSTDKTVEIAKEFGAKVYEEPHHEIFHITKQKALDKATGDWVLQLDADEVVTSDLSKEIMEVIKFGPNQGKLNPLFERHQRLIEKRDPAFAKSFGGHGGPIVAFFIPRLNLFLGKPLIHAGVYPDPAIRLIKRGKGHFPAKSVHEMMKIDGKIGWLSSNMLHNDSPTLKRYFIRLNRYTDLQAQELKEKRVPRNIFYLFVYSTIKPLFVFLNLFIRHKGFLDGIYGFLWSALSAMHYPIAYFKFWTMYNG
ncbi:MAG: glycosyltransferase family 2 protein [Patescibacteria group bacterium]